MLFQLGSMEFEGLNAPESMDSSGSANYAEHALIEGKPRLQRLGSKLDSVNMSLKIHRSFAIPENRISELQAARDNGEIMPLITGAGDVRGDFVITDVSVNYMRCADDGSIIEATIGVILKEYSTPDRSVRARTNAQRNAFALSENNPVPSSSPASQAVESDASEAITATAVSSTALSDSTDTAAQVPARELQERRKMAVSARKMIADANRVRGIINAFTGIRYDNTRLLDLDLISIVSKCSNVLGMLAGGSPLGDIGAEVELATVAVKSMKTNAAWLQSFTTARK